MDSEQKGSLPYKNNIDSINCKESIGKLKELFYNVNNFVAMIELKNDGMLGCFLEVNNEVCIKLKYSKEELLNITPYDVRGIDEKDIEEKRKKLLTEGKINFEKIYICKDEKEYEVEISSYIFDLYEVKVVIIISHNIVEMKRVKKISRESEKIYEKLLELLPDAAHVKYNEKIVFSNEAGARLLGYKTKEELIGRYDNEITQLEYLKNAVESNNLKNNKLYIEKRYRKTDGKIIDVEVASTEIVFNGGTAVISTIRDVTERKRWEAMLREILGDNTKLLSMAIELDRQRTEFFLNISHEFKTPLNVILGSIQLLENFKRNDIVKEDIGKIYKYNSIMKQNCYRLLRLINNLIDINKLDNRFLEANFYNYDIIGIIENITLSVADFGRNKGVTLIFDTEVEEKVISCDADKIERIMLNLLSNSIKYTELGGKIYVDIFDRTDSIIISVKDTGAGIPEDKLETIFERFQQINYSLNRKKEGSGIGLSLVKSFVELHKGRIWAESEVGVGTQFFIELPVNQILKERFKNNYNDYSSNLVERINIEFSDIYSLKDNYV